MLAIHIASYSYAVPYFYKNKLNIVYSIIMFN